jgi:hypothetical protein
MVSTMLDGVYHLFVVGTVRTVHMPRVCEHDAVLTAVPSSATLASLRSAPIVFHCLYYGLSVY